MLNVIDLTNGNILLGSDVASYMEAMYWLEHYRLRYGRNVPYPNGKGYYDGEFALCRRCECCGSYSVIH